MTTPPFVMVVVVIVVYDVSTGRFGGFDGGDETARMDFGLVRGDFVRIAGKE